MGKRLNERFLASYIELDKDCCEKFGTATGGVTEYINYHKIQLAKQYIQGRGLSLREISFQLGFDDPAYMSRLFKKTEGISYREYCQKYLK